MPLPDGLHPPTIAWAAGFLDGEGCFSLKRNRAGRYRIPSIEATQKIRAPLLELQRLFGGSIYHQGAVGKLGRLWAWHLGGGPQVVRCIKGILPFMHVKHEQAAIILEYAARIGGKAGIRIVTGEGIVRDEIAARLQDAKRRYKNAAA